MQPNQILRSSLLDIIFESRNKSYGAYELRNEYSSRLKTAILWMTGLVLCIFLYLKFVPVDPVNVTKIITIPDTSPAAPLGDPKPKDVKPVTKVKAATGPKAKGLPVVTTDPQDTDPIPGDHQPSGNGLPSAGPVTGGIEGPVSTGDTAVTIIPAAPAPVENKIYKNVQVEASFPGGIEAWRRYLQRNLNADIPYNNSAPPGTYRVLVTFIVSIDGKISNVTAETNHGYGMEKEAIKIISKGPLWTPAQQNDHYVNAYRSQPITFVVPE